jgi:hypothetical protein
MVVVKTDTDIYLNVEGFCASGGDDYNRPGLYIKPTSCDEYVPVTYCDVKKAREMLCDISRVIGRYRSDVLVLRIYDDGKIILL